MKTEMTRTVKRADFPLGLALAFIVVGAVVVLTTYLLLTGASPLSSDPAAYADPGRHIAQGDGFVTSRLHTALLPFISDLKPRPLLAPYMERPLFQPWYDALVFTMFGASELTVALANGPLFIALLIVVFLLARELFDGWAGLVAASLCLLDPTLLFVSTYGMSETGFMLAVVLSFYCVARGARTGTLGPLVWASLAAAFSQYARPVGFAYLIPLAVFLFLSHKERRGLKVALVLGLFALLTLPITIRSWYLFGSGNIHAVYLLLFMTPSFPGLSSYYSLDVPRSIGTIVARYGWEITAKWAKWMFAHVVFLFRMTNPATVAAAILGGLWLGPTNRLAASFGWSVLAAYGLTAATQSFVAWSARHVSHLVPFIAVLASGAIVAAWRAWAAGQRPLGRSFLAVAGLVLLISPLTADLHQKYKGRAARSETIKTFRAFGKFVEDHIAPDEVVASDLSLVIAWYGQRTSMTLPMDLETARRVRKAYVPFTAIILTSQRVHNPHFVSDETWRRAYRGEAEPLGFAIRARFEQGSLRAVLLRPKGWPDEVPAALSPDGAQGS